MDFDPRDYDARDLGRGSGESRESNADAHGQDPRDNARWPDREPLDRTFNPREPFTRDLSVFKTYGPRREEFFKTFPPLS